jgi:hypothetical protein
MHDGSEPLPSPEQTVNESVPVTNEAARNPVKGLRLMQNRRSAA